MDERDEARDECRTPRPEVYDSDEARRLAYLASLFSSLGNNFWESAGLLGKPDSPKFLAALARISAELLELREAIGDIYIEISARKGDGR